MAGKRAKKCIYHEEHTDEVGDIMVCTVHGQNSKHQITADDPNPPCLEMDPWDYQAEAVIKSGDVAPLAKGRGKTRADGTVMSTFPVNKPWADEGYRIGIVGVTSDGLSLTIQWIKEETDEGSPVGPASI